MQSRPLPLFAVFENQNKFREKPHETADSFGVCNQICIEEFTNKQSDQFQTLCHIGSGSFSDVFKVSSKEDGNIYAIKWTRTRHLDDSDRRTSLHDLYMLQQVVQHPNLVDFNRSWIQKGEIFTQQELCENGNLTSYLIHNDKLDEKVIWKLLFDIVLAVKQLHGQQIIHFDIKPDNIFISKNNYFKLGDFGLSHFKDFTSPISEGDSRYIAPEVLTQTLSTTSSDIFSIGVTVFEASERVIIPSDGPLWHKLREDPPHLEGRSQQLDQLVRSLLHSDPKCRPSVDIILHNPRMKQLMEKNGMKIDSILNIVFRRIQFILSSYWVKYYNLMKEKNTFQNNHKIKPEILDQQQIQLKQNELQEEENEENSFVSVDDAITLLLRKAETMKERRQIDNKDNQTQQSEQQQQINSQSIEQSNQFSSFQPELNKQNLIQSQFSLPFHLIQYFVPPVQQLFDYPSYEINEMMKNIQIQTEKEPNKQIQIQFYHSNLKIKQCRKQHKPQPQSENGKKSNCVKKIQTKQSPIFNISNTITINNTFQSSSLFFSLFDNPNFASLLVCLPLDIIFPLISCVITTSLSIRIIMKAKYSHKLKQLNSQIDNLIHKQASSLAFHSAALICASFFIEKIHPLPIQLLEFVSFLVFKLIQ